jgi:hypothetical protein
MMKGAQLRAKREHNDRVALAYLIVGLDRAKRLPEYDTLTLRIGPEPPAPKPKQTVEQMIANAIFVTRLMGGKVYPGEKVH